MKTPGSYRGAEERDMDLGLWEKGKWLQKREDRAAYCCQTYLAIYCEVF